MIRTYIRSKFETGVLPDGKVVEGGFGPIRGVLVAELFGDNVRVGYSMLHGKDMNDRQKKHGLNKSEKFDAAQMALVNVINLETLEGVHTIVKKMLPGFLKRCGSCYLEAKTINGVDITPYRRDYTVRMNACKNIATNLEVMAAGLLKLSDRMKKHSLNTGRDEDFTIFNDGAAVSSLEQLVQIVIKPLANGDILSTYSHRELDKAFHALAPKMHDLMLEIYGDAAKTAKENMEKAVPAACSGCGCCH